MFVRKAFLSLWIGGISSCLAFTYSPSFASSIQYSYEAEQIEAPLQALASLSYYLRTQAEETDGSADKGASLYFSEEEVDKLWSKAMLLPSFQAIHPLKIELQILLEKAYFAYIEARQLESDEARQKFKEAYLQATALWEQALELELGTDYEMAQMFRHQANKDFENNASIPSSVKDKIRPYVIPDTHSMKKNLDAIFLRTRATTNQKTFKAAGFKTLRKGPRSYVHVASHPSLPFHLVKAYMDNELEKKRGHSSSYWMIKRCEGAKKIAEIIQKKRIRYFVVASKWIYPFPAQPSPPKDALHTRHCGLLLVTDMDLAPKKENHFAWSHLITPGHLDELYVIISRAKGSSYRPDNISFTKSGLFAFIDTEYPSGGPDYKSIRSYLSTEMQDYWDELVRRGGK